MRISDLAPAAAGVVVIPAGEARAARTDARERHPANKSWTQNFIRSATIGCGESPAYHHARMFAAARLASAASARATIVAARTDAASTSYLTPPRRARAVAATAMTGPRDHGLIMEREPLTLAPDEPLWVFGYGSIGTREDADSTPNATPNRVATVPRSRPSRAPLTLSPVSSLLLFSAVWKVGFEYEERVICCARGWRRRFHQGSTDHRGTPDFPGRTVTLERCHPTDEPPCWGAAYRVSSAAAPAVLDLLEIREKQYDLRLRLDLHADDAPDAPVVVRGAVTYVATEDPANLNWLGEPEGGLEACAAQIAAAEGPSGRNDEYLFKLAEAMRWLGVEDAHLYELEARVRAIGEEARA